MRRKLACAYLLCAHGAAAQTEGAPVAVAPEATSKAPTSVERGLRVLVVQGVDAGWATRVRGQLIDLPTVVMESASIDGGAAEPPAAKARRLAHTHDADLVVWLSGGAPSSDGSAGDSAVLIWSAHTEQLHRRRLGSPWSTLSSADRSAALEIAALSVRSAVHASSADALAAAEAPPAPPLPARRDHEFQLSLGGSWQLDGQTSMGSGAAGAELGVRWGRWSGAVGGSFGLDAGVEARGAELRLRRHGVFLEGAYALLDPPLVSLDGLTRAGLSLSRRVTRATSPDALPLAPETQLSALLGVGLRAQVRYAPSHALTLALVANWLLAPPSYSIQAPEADETFEYPLWNIQPSAELRWRLNW